MQENRHDEVTVLVMAIDRLAEGQNKTNEKVDKLVESMGKQEVILEKLSNIKKEHSDSQKRVHSRIDTNEESIKALVTMQQDGSPFTKAFIARRDLEVKHYDMALAGFDTRITINAKALADLNAIPSRIVAKIIMVAIGALTVAWIGMPFVSGL